MVLPGEQFLLENENEIMTPPLTQIALIHRPRHRCASGVIANMALF
jgi:hypothetical protein